ncbi:hypothetical protein SCHAM137S_01907 [Streptomyces chartreusis]
MRLRQNTFAHPLVEGSADGAVQKFPCVPVAERPDGTRRQSGQFPEAVDVLGGKDEGNALGGDAPGHEGEHGERTAVHPLRVVDQADDRLLLGAGGQQAQDRQPQVQRVGGRSRAASQRDAQRLALRLRQAGEMAQ